MGWCSCTERAGDSRPGGDEHRGNGGFGRAPLPIVGVVDRAHVFSLGFGNLVDGVKSDERNPRDQTAFR
jgi:hypothetical protein